MKDCWSQGELRASLDGELSLRDMERLTAHLNLCPECSRLQAELSRTAARIAVLLEAVPSEEPARMPAIPPAAGSGRGIATVGLALAAALAIAFLLLPGRGEKHPVLSVSKPPLAAQTPAPSAPPPVEVKPGILRKAPGRRAIPAKPKPHVVDYVALDDDPIETGVVVRVSLDGDRLPADVIFGPDGRARAIRLVNEFSGER